MHLETNLAGLLVWAARELFGQCNRRDSTRMTLNGTVGFARQATICRIVVVTPDELRRQ